MQGYGKDRTPNGGDLEVKVEGQGIKSSVSTCILALRYPSSRSAKMPNRIKSKSGLDSIPWFLIGSQFFSSAFMSAVFQRLQSFFACWRYVLVLPVPSTGFALLLGPAGCLRGIGRFGFLRPCRRNWYCRRAGKGCLCRKLREGERWLFEKCAVFKGIAFEHIAAWEIVSGCIGGDHVYVWREGRETVCLCAKGDSPVETIFMKRASSLKACEWCGIVSGLSRRAKAL